MTRKDYINIAAAILATNARIKASFDALRRDHSCDPEALEDIASHRDSQLRGVRRTAAHLATFLADDNPKDFDPVLFLQNCGYGA